MFDWFVKRYFPQQWEFRQRVEKRIKYLQRLHPVMDREMARHFAEHKEYEIDLARRTGEIHLYADVIAQVDEPCSTTSAAGLPSPS